MERIFGKKVQQVRKKNGWTIREFIEKIGVDLSPSYITKIEIHGEIPAPEVIRKIADALKVPHKELWDAAKSDKIQDVSDSLDAKYEELIETDHRLTLRISSDLMKRIDDKRREKAGKVSRNLWIIEAISGALSTT